MNVKQIPILNADADELSRISQEGLLSLNLAEMQAIQAHFAKLKQSPKRGQSIVSTRHLRA